MTVKLVQDPIGSPEFLIIRAFYPGVGWRAMAGGGLYANKVLNIAKQIANRGATDIEIRSFTARPGAGEIAFWKWEGCLRPVLRLVV